jgi:hypothetical protein
MTALYTDALSQATAIQRKAIAARQDQWRSLRDSCSNEKDVKGCVKQVYSAHNEVLRSYASGNSAASID